MCRHRRRRQVVAGAGLGICRQCVPDFRHIGYIYRAEFGHPASLILDEIRESVASTFDRHRLGLSAFTCYTTHAKCGKPKIRAKMISHYVLLRKTDE